MPCHNSDLANTSDWLNQMSYAARPIRSTTQIWLVKGHQYGMSAIVPQTPFGGKPVLASRGNISCFLRLQISAREIAQLSSKAIRTKKKVHFASLPYFSPFHFCDSSTVSLSHPSS